MNPAWGTGVVALLLTSAIGACSREKAEPMPRGVEAVRWDLAAQEADTVKLFFQAGQQARPYRARVSYRDSTIVMKLEIRRPETGTLGGVKYCAAVKLTQPRRARRIVDGTRTLAGQATHRRAFKVFAASKPHCMPVRVGTGSD